VRRYALGLVAAVPVALVLAACSSSSKSTAPADTSAAAPSTSASVNESAAPGSSSPATSGVATQLAALTTRPTQILQLPAWTKPFPQAKTIDLVTTNVPAGVSRGTELKGAVEAAGWKLKILSAGSGANPALVTQAMQQAVVDKPEAVMVVGFPNILYKDQVKQLAALKIPLIELFTTDAQDEASGLFVVDDVVNARQQGGTEAVALIAKLGAVGSTHAVFVNTPSYPVVDAYRQGFAAKYSSLCSACKLDVLNIPASSIGQDVPTRIVAYLQAHKDINAIAYGFADLATGVPAALSTANIKSVKAAVADGTSTLAIQYLKGGSIDALVNSPATWMYYALEVAARFIAGEPSNIAMINAQASWLVTKDNLPTDSPLAAGQDVVDVLGYNDQFKKLWGK
jgi:ribose transport system substrate-binding protein